MHTLATDKPDLTLKSAYHIPLRLRLLRHNNDQAPYDHRFVRDKEAQYSSCICNLLDPQVAAPGEVLKPRRRGYSYLCITAQQRHYLRHNPTCAHLCTPLGHAWELTDVHKQVVTHYRHGCELPLLVQRAPHVTRLGPLAAPIHTYKE